MTRPELSPRASYALRLIVQLRYISQAQLSELLFGGSNIAPASRRVLLWRILSSLDAGRLIRPLDRVVGGPGGGSSAVVYRPTPEGRRLASVFDASLVGSPTSDGTFLQRHALAVADVLIALSSCEAVRLTGWETDWQIGRRGDRLPILPDLHVELGISDFEIEAVVEVDLGTEGHRFFDEKIRRYLRLWRSGAWRQVFRDWPLVLVVAATDRRSEILRDWTERLIRSEYDWTVVTAGTEFAFTSLPQLRKEGPLAGIWHQAGKRLPVSLAPDMTLQ